MDAQLNSDLITRSLNFHGQQLQKLWESEHGEQDLVKRNVKDLDFLVYGQRQKHLAFHDRGKRLRLHQFIAKKADVLFATETCEENPSPDVPTADDVYAVMPPFEIYLNVDKQQRLRYFFQNVKKGDYILGTIASKAPSGMMLKVLCSLGPTMRYVADLNVKAACPTANIIPAVDKKGTSRGYMMNDSVCCEVLEVVPDCDKMVCGMKGAAGPPPPGCPPPGLVASDDFPLLYKKAVDTKGESYEVVLEKSIGFNNPNNMYHLMGILGLGTQHRSNMLGLRCRFPQQEYASELRQVQASKWAFRSVADGIDHFKAGRHSEAFQCLNKALNIDPRNVEGLVARGALYANSGNFRKAIEDFETALKLNPSHANARKYMGETLVALGRSYEEDEKFEDARKAYQNCLSIIPFHEEAQNSLEFLKNKGGSGAIQKNIVAPEELLLPALSTKQSIEVQDALEQLLKGGGPEQDDEKKEKKKKRKSKNKKRRHRSSSSSSTSSSASSHSSSSSSSSSSESTSGSSESDSKSKRKKRRPRSHRHEKQKSLSPLSKRMAMMDATHDTPSTYQFNKPAGAASSFDFDFEQPSTAPKVTGKDAEYEAKVRSFLEQNKEEDSDYENRVRKFLEETARWKKEKKLSDEKKKKKKKEKKAKKENKKKRKEKKLKAQKEVELRDALRKELGLGKEKRKNKRGLTSDDEDYLYRKGISKRILDSLPELEELESKLSAIYALEKADKSKSNHSGSSSPVQRFDHSPSPTREQKARQAVAEASANAPNVFAPKWKMQIGNSNASGSRFKKKMDREEWDDVQEESKFQREKESPKLGPSAEEKAMSIRKAMAMKEPPPKKEPLPPNDAPKQRRGSPKPPPPKPPLVNTSGPVVLDKFGNFRIASPATAKKLQHDDDLPPLPPGAPPPQQFAKKSSRPPEPPGPPRLGSSSPGRKRRTPTRSRSRTSRSSSRSRSRSPRRGGYDRSRSRSYYSGSRSRSRSRSYYSRSRSRSRSRSGDRRRYRGGYRGRYNNDRGTYYKPRLQYKNQRGGGNYRGRGGYRDYRDDRYGNGYRDYRGRGGRGYNNRGGRRPRGRFNRGGYRDYRDRRYRRSDSRSVSRDRSYSREADDPMQKVNEEKEKINKYIDNSDPPPKHDGPLSEGEDRDDYNGDKYVDRQAYDGKWADKDADGRTENSEAGGKGGGDASIPSETNVEEMDKFLSKVKKEKKEEMIERNKDVLKSKQW